MAVGRWSIFTQEDPIGLAGGLNLYGFAGGDPVNFSDPFGLCPECEEGEDEGPEGRGRRRHLAIGVQGLLGIGPIVGAFVGGGVNLGITDEGRVFVQAQVSLGLGVGAFAGVGLQAGVDRPLTDLSTRVNVETSTQLTANVGLVESVGVAASFDNDGNFTGASGSQFLRAGVGVGGQASIQRVRSVTVASPPLEVLRKLLDLFR